MLNGALAIKSIMGLVFIIFAGLAVLFLTSYLLARLVSAVIGFSLRGRTYTKKLQTYSKYAVMLGLPLWVIYGFYFSFNPRDDFYLQRLSLIALRDVPKSARIVAKSPSLFGLHSGESCAYSRIAVSKEDYLALHKSIASDSRFVIASKRYEKIQDGKSVVVEESKVPESDMRNEVNRIAGGVSEKSSYVRADLEQPFNRQYALIFLSDEKHIEAHSCL